METIFDHGATLEELAAIWGEEFATPEDYLEFLEDDQQAALADLVRLAKIRQDDELRGAMLPRIEDPLFRLQLSFTPCQEAGRRLEAEKSLRENRQAA